MWADSGCNCILLIVTSGVTENKLVTQNKFIRKGKLGTGLGDEHLFSKGARTRTTTPKRVTETQVVLRIKYLYKCPISLA